MWIPSHCSPYISDLSLKSLVSVCTSLLLCGKKEKFRAHLSFPFTDKVFDLEMGHPSEILTQGGIPEISVLFSSCKK